MKSKVECCGRNGMFVFNSFEVYTNGNNITTVGIGSKKIGKMYPIIFRGEIKDLRVLFEDILDELEAENEDLTGDKYVNE